MKNQLFERDVILILFLVVSRSIVDHSKIFQKHFEDGRPQFANHWLAKAMSVTLQKNGLYLL